ncbi:MAG: tRNA uridine-5-carboxymethylaminomethyl(34) synthesis GTPase MnmE [Opitutales bacterium]|nr:tRNA uridine-5-carboxymethylaminomethyl(34) synthesis GTPase MnmE [Opitutales bacterium]
MSNFCTTIIAPSTPLQESALILLRGSGPFSGQFLQDAFCLKEFPKARHVYWGKYHSVEGEILDDCVFTYFKAPSSYTGEDSFEISCHGNPLIAFNIVADARERGCESAKPGEFTQRAFLNGKMDLSQAEAVQTLISAQSEEEITSSRRFLSGELKEMIKGWAASIYSLIADLEAGLDFSEEEIPEFHVEQQKKQLKQIIDQLSGLISHSRYLAGAHKYLTVSIVGAPNAGKSSLFNLLVGNSRSIVAPVAGTTRDFISEVITIKKHTFRLIDTAGLHNNSLDPIEVAGMERTLSCLEDSDFVLYLIDRSDFFPSRLPAIEKIDPNKTLVLFTKSDLPAVFNPELVLEGFKKMQISLKNENILEELSGSLINFLKENKILPPAGTLFLGLRQLDLLKHVQKTLNLLLDDFGTVSDEFHVEQLRLSVNLLEQFMGHYNNERTLDKIFSSFCIGK